MGKRVHVLVAVWCFLGLALVENASCVHLTITPDNPTENVDPSVQFSCTLGRDIKEVTEVVVMNIENADRNEQVAHLTNTGVTYKIGNAHNKYQAKGFLSKDVSKIYFNLTLLVPKVEDSGYYACSVHYIDSEGLSVTSKYSARLVVKQAGKPTGHDLETIVESLARRVESLETSSTQRDQTIKDIESSSKMYQDEMRMKYSALDSKVNHKSVFSAGIKEKMARTPLSPNMVIAFDDVILKEGQGYDESRGIFTADRKGLYVFHLVMGTWSTASSFTDVALTVNGNVKANLQTTNFNSNKGGNQDQTEVSLVTVLSVGDQVQAVTSGDTTRDEQMIGELCLFSGYLLRSYE